MANEDTANEAMFTGLVMMLASSAMQALGKVVNPATGKAEISLETAQASIDLLSMLQVKTQGNLNEAETRLLGDTVSSLQMNYVDTAKSQPAAATASEETAPADDTLDKPADTAAEAAPAADSPASDTRSAAREPKYHKSYG